jgi:hypothetical protein
VIFDDRLLLLLPLIVVVVTVFVVEVVVIVVVDPSGFVCVFTTTVWGELSGLFAAVG